MAITNQFPGGGEKKINGKAGALITIPYTLDGLGMMTLPTTANWLNNIYSQNDYLTLPEPSTSASLNGWFVVLAPMKTELKCYKNASSYTISEYATVHFEPGYKYYISMDKKSTSSSYGARTNKKFTITRYGLDAGSIYLINWAYAAGVDNTESALNIKLEKE